MDTRSRIREWSGPTSDSRCDRYRPYIGGKQYVYEKRKRGTHSYQFVDAYTVAVLSESGTSNAISPKWPAFSNCATTFPGAEASVTSHIPEQMKYMSLPLEPSKIMKSLLPVISE